MCHYGAHVIISYYYYFSHPGMYVGIIKKKKAIAVCFKHNEGHNLIPKDLKKFHFISASGQNPVKQVEPSNVIKILPCR